MHEIWQVAGLNEKVGLKNIRNDILMFEWAFVHLKWAKFIYFSLSW